MNWSRMIALVDMNCFFAQIEQMDYAPWRNKPVAVTNGVDGTTIITCSYEARYLGVQTGMKLYQARQLCPELIQAPSRPYRYAELSTAIMAALIDISPDVEVFSVDEAFLDLTRCQQLYRGPYDIGRRIKQKVLNTSGLVCSVGISGDKTTAKFAAKQQKPDGLTVIAPELVAKVLAPQPVTVLSGVNKGMSRFLASYGVQRCGEMKALPMRVLSQRFGNVGKRIWLMAQGLDPEPVHLNVKAPQRIGHGKVLPPKTSEAEVILTYFQHMAEKVANRMRCFGYKAKSFFIGAKTQQGWLKVVMKATFDTDDGQTIYYLCRQFLSEHWHGQIIRQVQVTALSPQTGQQLELFAEQDIKRQEVNTVMDAVNHRFGELSLAPARLLNKSSMPNVLAPAWRPDGLRKLI